MKPERNGTEPRPYAPPEVDWADLYAELRNKVRWAIGSTIAESGAINLPYRAQTALAGVVAQDILEALKEVHEKPDLRIDTESARSLLKR